MTAIMRDTQPVTSRAGWAAVGAASTLAGFGVMAGFLWLADLTAEAQVVAAAGLVAAVLAAGIVSLAPEPAPLSDEQAARRENQSAAWNTPQMIVLRVVMVLAGLALLFGSCQVVYVQTG